MLTPRSTPGRSEQLLGPSPLTVRIYKDQPDRSQPPLWIAEAHVNGKLFHVRVPGAPVFHLARHMAGIGVPDAPLQVGWGLRPDQPLSHYPSFHRLAQSVVAPVTAPPSRSPR